MQGAEVVGKKAETRQGDTTKPVAEAKTNISGVRKAQLARLAAQGKPVELGKSRHFNIDVRNFMLQGAQKGTPQRMHNNPNAETMRKQGKQANMSRADQDKIAIAGATLKFMQSAAQSQLNATVQGTQALLDQQATFQQQLVNYQNQNLLDQANYNNLQLQAQNQLNTNISRLRKELAGANEQQKALLLQQIDALEAGFSKQNKIALDQLAEAKRTNELLKGMVKGLEAAAAAATASDEARAAAAAEPRNIPIYFCTSCGGSLGVHQCSATTGSTRSQEYLVSQSEIMALMNNRNFNNGVLREDPKGGYNIPRESMQGVLGAIGAYRRQIGASP